MHLRDSDLAPLEENSCADFIAKLALGSEEDFQLLESPLKTVLTLIEADKVKKFCIPQSSYVTKFCKLFYSPNKKKRNAPRAFLHGKLGIVYTF